MCGRWNDTQFEGRYAGISEVSSCCMRFVALVFVITKVPQCIELCTVSASGNRGLQCNATKRAAAFLLNSVGHKAQVPGLRRWLMQ